MTDDLINGAGEEPRDGELAPLERWRLMLGRPADRSCGGLEGGAAAADRALSWLYDQDGELARRDIGPGSAPPDSRAGGPGASTLTVPEWINDIHELFPKETIERLERDAVERFGIDEVVTNPDVLRRVEPNPSLLAAVLRTKHLMNPDVLELARQLVRKVVKQLVEALAVEVASAFSGARNRQRHTRIAFSRNFDAFKTLRENLRHWDPERRQLLIERPWFVSRIRQHTSRWQVILLVDQSGSMLSSTIHSAVTASCLWGLPAVKTHLAVFDTEVVDLTRDVTDPVEALMKVQLGGGTHIARAVDWAASIVDNPRRCIIALVTDFYEGGDARRLVRTVKALCEQGTTVLGLAALDERANPDYDRQLAGQCAAVGAHVGAMTPGELVGFIADKVGR